MALGHHRFQWLHVAAFVQPTSGETVWYLCSRINKPGFELLLAAFARESGAGRERHIVLVLDNAGWHGPKGLAVPDGITLVFLPPTARNSNPPSGSGRCSTRRWPTSTSPPWPTSTPPSPNAAPASTPP